MRKAVAIYRHHLSLTSVDNLCYQNIRLLLPYYKFFILFSGQDSNINFEKLCLGDTTPILIDPINNTKSFDYIKHIFEKHAITKLIYLWHRVENIKTWRKIKNIDLIFWLHNEPFWEIKNRIARWQNPKITIYIHRYPKWLNRILKPFDLFLYKYRIKHLYQQHLHYFDYYIVLHPLYEDVLIKQLGTKYKKKLISIINQVPIPDKPKLNKKKQFVFVGRMTLLDKQIDRLIRIWYMVQEQLPDWSFHLYGDGWLLPHLIQFAKKKECKRIFFHGSQSDMQPLYNEAAILGLTSNFEGYPLCLIEAQSNGVVPIVFNSSRCMEAIIGQNQEAGIIVEPFDLDKFANALVELCRNEEKRKNLQIQCIEKIKREKQHNNISSWQKILG